MCNGLQNANAIIKATDNDGQRLGRCVCVYVKRGERGGAMVEWGGMHDSDKLARRNMDERHGAVVLEQWCNACGCGSRTWA